MSLEDKIRQEFENMVVLKNPSRTQFFFDLSLPSYMRDWLVMKFSDEDGEIDNDCVEEYINRYLPSNKDAYEGLKFDMVNGERVRFLARVRVSVDVRSGKTTFELPDFGGTKTGASGEIDNEVVAEQKEILLSESENWGIIDLIWTKRNLGKNSGVVRMVRYEQFCPYQVDLDFYKNARNSFTTEEWIDVLISASDFNPKGYRDEEQKLYFLRRLLPFVEKRINLMELAPMGTGKSYVFQKISKRGWLISGGTISRASLIYDNAKKTGGLLTRFDFVAFDEIQSMTFKQPSEIQTALKDYMEFGEVQGFDAKIVANSGVIVLGNFDPSIDSNKLNENQNLMSEICPVFSEPASLDRFHGFIKGWKIPRLHQGLVADGWALNTEYFAEVLHLLREDSSYLTIVEDSLKVPSNADKRDLTAIKRLCTAFVKLLFPNACSKEDIEPSDFIKYCLEPAKEMRQIIRKQLFIIDRNGINIQGTVEVPDIQYRYD